MATVITAAKFKQQVLSNGVNTPAQFNKATVKDQLVKKQGKDLVIKNAITGEETLVTEFFADAELAALAPNVGSEFAALATYTTVANSGWVSALAASTLTTGGVIAGLVSNSDGTDSATQLNNKASTSTLPTVGDELAFLNQQYNLNIDGPRETIDSPTLHTDNFVYQANGLGDIDFKRAVIAFREGAGGADLNGDKYADYTTKQTTNAGGVGGTITTTGAVLYGTATGAELGYKVAVTHAGNNNINFSYINSYSTTHADTLVSLPEERDDDGDFVERSYLLINGSTATGTVSVDVSTETPPPGVVLSTRLPDSFLYDTVDLNNDGRSELFFWDYSSQVVTIIWADALPQLGTINLDNLPAGVGTKISLSNFEFLDQADGSVFIRPFGLDSNVMIDLSKLPRTSGELALFPEEMTANQGAIRFVDTTYLGDSPLIVSDTQDGYVLRYEYNDQDGYVVKALGNNPQPNAAGQIDFAAAPEVTDENYIIWDDLNQDGFTDFYSYGYYYGYSDNDKPYHPDANPVLLNIIYGGTGFDGGELGDADVANSFSITRSAGEFAIGDDAVENNRLDFSYVPDMDGDGVNELVVNFSYYDVMSQRSFYDDTVVILSKNRAATIDLANLENYDGSYKVLGQYSVYALNEAMVGNLLPGGGNTDTLLRPRGSSDINIVDFSGEENTTYTLLNLNGTSKNQPNQVIGDLNNDGYNEIAVVNSTGINVLWGGQSLAAAFAEAAVEDDNVDLARLNNLPEGSYTSLAATSGYRNFMLDMNNDGAADWVLVSDEDKLAQAKLTVIYAGGNASFDNAAVLDLSQLTTAQGYSITANYKLGTDFTFADVNGDGIVDVNVYGVNTDSLEAELTTVYGKTGKTQANVTVGEAAQVGISIGLLYDTGSSKTDGISNFPIEITGLNPSLPFVITIDDDEVFNSADHENVDIFFNQSSILLRGSYPPFSSDGVIVIGNGTFAAGDIVVTQQNGDIEIRGSNATAITLDTEAPDFDVEILVGSSRMVTLTEDDFELGDVLYYDNDGSDATPAVAVTLVNGQAVYENANDYFTFSSLDLAGNKYTYYYD